MKVLLLGSGGREHALACAIARSSRLTELVLVPGNPGTASLGRNVALNPSNPEAVLALAREIPADLVVIGPEAPLVAGVADTLRAAGFPVFGPSRAAAQLEGSKAFAKEIMAAAGVPTAEAVACTTMEEARAALTRFGAPYVVKQDGLAAGKGVVVTEDFAVALQHAQDFIDAASLGAISKSAAPQATSAGTCDGENPETQSRPVLDSVSSIPMAPHEPGTTSANTPAGTSAKPVRPAVVIEEYLDGPEASVFCLCDGQDVIPLPPAQDYKRALDGGKGPNTGGMGAYSPLPWAPPDLAQRTAAEIARPVLSEMARRGTPFVGLLYVGLALTRQGSKVVEFNVRFGDPETQSVLPRLESDLLEYLLAAATGSLGDMPELRVSSEAVVNVVLAAPGYPGTPQLGGVITGLDAAEAVPGVQVIHAGTRMAPHEPGASTTTNATSVTGTTTENVSKSETPAANATGAAPEPADTPVSSADSAVDIRSDGTLVSSGGRVLSVVARGQNLDEARERAYGAMAKIHLKGGHFRHDIAALPQ